MSQTQTMMPLPEIRPVAVTAAPNGTTHGVQVGDWLVFLRADGGIDELPAPGSARSEAFHDDLARRVSVERAA